MKEEKRHKRNRKMKEKDNKRNEVKGIEAREK